MDFLALEDGPDNLSRNVSMELPLYAAYPVERRSFRTLIQQWHTIGILHCLESKVQLLAHTLELNTLRSPQLHGSENMRQ